MYLLKSVLRQMLVSASVLCTSVISFTSCDSREDWFAKEGEGATFIIKLCGLDWYENYYGNHTVYYRCMDDMGIWSMWYSQTINME